MVDIKGKYTKQANAPKVSSSEMEEQMAEFLAKGSKIEEVPIGVSTYDPRSKFRNYEFKVKNKK
jgi:hypothetical protein